MDDVTARKLVEINRIFYADFAAAFAATRSGPQPGFASLLRWLPTRSFALLDVGCGEGRFRRSLADHGAVFTYTGVDMTADLLERARLEPTDVMIQRDLSQPNCLAGLGTFDCIACLSTLQHIPGQANRVRVLAEMREHLSPGGVLLLGNWQFMDSPRQRRKLVAWARVGIDPAQVGPEDHLLTWNKGGSGLRYAAHLDEAMVLALAAEAGLRQIASFHSDGREGNLNLYSILGV